MKNRSLFYLLGVLALLGLSLAAWGPLVRDYLRIDNDFSAFYRFALPVYGDYEEYHANKGIWRLLGGYFNTWSLTLPGALPGLVIVLAHFISCALLFLACARIWANQRAALIAASLYCIYPWGYGLLPAGAMTAMPAGPALLWIVVLWLHHKVCRPESARWFELPLAAGYVVAAISTSDRLSFCYPMLSAWAVWVVWSRRPTSPAIQLRASAVVMAPVIGFAIFTVLYLVTKQSDLNPPGLHLPALVSTFVKQFRHYHHFVPLLSPGVWPTFVFYEWSAKQLVIVALGGIMALLGLFAALRRAGVGSGEAGANKLDNLQKLGLTAALLVGAAAVFVAAGGYSDEIYKRYPIGSVLAFAFCGFLSLVPAASRALFSAPGKVALVCLAAVFIFTDWLHAGIWRYEVRSLHKLVDLIHRESLPIPATIQWAHEPRAFWPQLNTITEAMRTGENLTGDVWELYMEKFQLRPPEVSPAIRAFYSEKEEWVVEPSTP